MEKEITIDMIRYAWEIGVLGIRENQHCISVVWGIEGQDTCLIHPLHNNVMYSASDYVKSRQGIELYRDILRSLGRTVDDRLVKMPEDLWNAWYEALSGNGYKREIPLPIYDGT